MKKNFLLLLPIVLIFWFFGGKVISHVISISIDAFLGYYMLFLLCNRIMSKKKFKNFDDLLKEYNVIGVTRVILTSFQDFAETFDLKRKMLLKYLNNYLKDTNVEEKPHIKDNTLEDKKIILLSLIKTLESNDKICHGIDYKHIVEDNFSDKWGYFYHAKYIGKIINEINVMCGEENLPALGILVVYSNEIIDDGYFSYCNGRWKIEDGIVEDTKITDEKVQNVLQKMRKDIDKYKEMVKKIV